MFEGDLSGTTNATSMFKQCSQLQYVTLTNTGNITTMHSMFMNAGPVKEIYIEDISNVTNMYYMFRDCVNLTSVTMKGDPSKITNTLYMFDDDLKTIGTFYYDSRYDYSKIIKQLPAT